MPRTPQIVPFKRFPKTDVSVAIAHPSGQVSVQYGGSLGSETFLRMSSAGEKLAEWARERRRLLALQLVELEEVERYAEAMRDRAGGPD